GDHRDLHSFPTRRSSDLFFRRHPDVRVEVTAVDVGVDAADRGDGADEAEEVDVDHVVDFQPGQCLDHLQRQLGTAGGVGGVELFDPDAGDVGLQVARDRHHRDQVLFG